MKNSDVTCYLKGLSFLPLAGLLAFAHGLTLESGGGFMWDGLVTHNKDTRLRVTQNLGNDFTLGGRAQYLWLRQDSISGINRLEDRLVSFLGEVQWTAVPNLLIVEALGGIDKVREAKTHLRYEISLNLGVPLPANPVLKTLRIKPGSWHSYSHMNAPMVANGISSRGWEVDVAGSLGSRFGFGGNYRADYLAADDPLLDTAFMAPVPGGVPQDSLSKNKISAFYIYLYAQIIKGLHCSFAFSWSDSRRDRWVVTRSEPVFSGFPPQIVALKQSYTYYPYTTPLQSIGYIFGLNYSQSFMWGILLQLKAAVPVYSSRKVFSSPAYIDPYYTGEYYKEEFTGALTFSGSLKIPLNYKTGLSLEYETFSLPYLKWAYFSRNSYSYHKLNLSLKYRV